MAATERLAAVDVPLDQLTPHPRNPRTIRPERLEHLKRTLEAERGMLDARPLIALPDGTVVAGNQRLEAARQLGWATIPVVYADLTVEQQTRWMLLDNRPFGDDNEQAVAVLLQELEEAGSDIDLTGYTRQDTDRMLRELTRPERDPDEAPPVPVEPRSQRGELYELGPHRLMCGDALTDMATLMGDDLARLVVTSPPYNQALDSFTPSGMQTENPAWVERMASAYSDSRPEDEYQDEQVALLDTLLDFTTADASVFYNHKIRYRDMVALSPRAWIDRTRWSVRQEVIWDRASSITLNARMFMPIDERIYWLARGDFYFANTTEIKAMSTVWRIAPRADIPLSAPFPVELPARCISACSERGDIVADPYGGSGTTLVAADDARRRAYLMEIDPAYCDVIRQRYADHTGQPQYAP